MPCNSPRNLDISALRSFVTVAELGGVTRAAERLNLTRSAVSMQLKRLETAFDQPLMQRHGRGVCLTSEGEQLLGYGRRMVKLNEETWNRMMLEAFESRVSFGVPEDIVRLYVTGMLREFVGAFPRARCCRRCPSTSARSAGCPPGPPAPGLRASAACSASAALCRARSPAATSEAGCGASAGASAG